MNLMMLVGSTAQGLGSGSSAVGNACALCLFVSGLISLAIAGYLLYKGPTFNPVRFRR